MNNLSNKQIERKDTLAFIQNLFTVKNKKKKYNLNDFSFCIASAAINFINDNNNENYCRLIYFCIPLNLQN